MNELLCYCVGGDRVLKAWDDSQDIEMFDEMMKLRCDISRTLRHKFDEYVMEIDLKCGDLSVFFRHFVSSFYANWCFVMDG